MKFGRYLESNLVAGWEAHYIDYKGLKELLKTMKLGETGPQRSLVESVTSRDKAVKGELNESDFAGKIDQEISKINQFTVATGQEIRSRVAKLLESDESLSSEESEAMKTEVEACEHDLINLEKFVNLNMTGFVKILKKHDKHSPIQLMQGYMVRLWKEPFLNDKLDKVLISLSQLNSKLRGEKSHSSAERSGYAQVSVRKARKFWVKLEDMTKLKVLISKYLPITQFDGVEDNQNISCVYYDNAAMEMYSSRLDQKDKASLLCIRWYGNEEPTKASVEKTTLHTPLTGPYSEKKSIEMNTSKLVPFLTGTSSLNDEAPKFREQGMSEDEIIETLKLGHEIQRLVEMKQLVPAVRVFFNRTEFKQPGSSDIRITLDANIRYILERFRMGEWKRDTRVGIPIDHAAQLPFAVLEIKTQNDLGQSLPSWIQTLVDDPILIKAEQFSKYLYGCASLLPTQVPSQPEWIKKIDGMKPKPPSSSSFKASSTSGNKAPGKSSGSDTKKQSIRPQAATLRDYPGENEGARQSSPPSYSQKTQLTNRRQGIENNPYESSCCSMSKDLAIKYPMRVEPKTFFANERTYLSWVKIALTLCVFALSFIGLSDRRGVMVGSLILLGTGVFFTIYAYVTYVRRIVQMKAREDGPYFDRFGAALLVIVLNCAVILSALSTVFIKETADKA